MKISKNFNPEIKNSAINKIGQIIGATIAVVISILIIAIFVKLFWWIMEI